jgi:peptide chain release factor subunit 1
MEHYKEFGAKLEFITDKSQEGFQFVKGFGAIGAFLRYNVDFLDEFDGGADKDSGDSDGFNTDEDFI